MFLGNVAVDGHLLLDLNFSTYALFLMKICILIYINIIWMTKNGYIFTLNRHLVFYKNANKSMLSFV